jgi:maltooligosyltrehalose trehalohydrolase
VREILLANAEMWIRDFHADGLRLDATHAIFDASEVHILREIGERARTAGSGRSVLVIAEDDRNDARLVTPVERGGLGLDGVWADDFHHQLRRAFAGDSDGYYSDYAGSTEDIAETLRGGWYYRGQESKHQKKARGTAPESIEPPRLVHCIQNHDQIGNRALGDRLGERVSPAGERAMSALLLLSPYTPLLFMGQEWSASTPFLYFTDHNEELGRAVTEGRRREFGHFEGFQSLEVPDPQDAATFGRSKLKWEELGDPPRAGMLAWYKELLALRASHPCLKERGRDAFTATAIGPKALLLERKSGEGKLLVVVTIEGPLDLSIEGAGEGAQEARVLAWSEETRFGGAGGPSGPLDGGRVRMNGPGAVIVELYMRAGAR